MERSHMAAIFAVTWGGPWSGPTWRPSLRSPGEVHGAVPHGGHLCRHLGRSMEWPHMAAIFALAWAGYVVGQARNYGNRQP